MDTNFRTFFSADSFVEQEKSYVLAKSYLRIVEEGFETVVDSNEFDFVEERCNTFYFSR